jgi:hypothetical protein
MALDTSELLGASQVAGAKVNPIGAARKNVRGVGGAAIIPTEIAAKLMFGKKSKALQESQTPQFGRIGYLAATDGELAIIRLSGKQTEVVARVPRSEAAAAEISGAMIGKLVITFRDGTQWAFEIPPQYRKGARAIVELFTTERIVGAAR